MEKKTTKAPAYFIQDRTDKNFFLHNDDEDEEGNPLYILRRGSERAARFSLTGGDSLIKYIGANNLMLTPAE